MHASRPLPARLAALSVGVFVALIVCGWSNNDAKAALLPSISPEQAGHEQLTGSKPAAAQSTQQATITAPAQLGGSSVMGDSVSVRSALGVPHELQEDIDVEKPANPGPRQALPQRSAYRYFTVDLSEQKACAKIDGLAVFCDSVSTGLTGPTPIGHFKVYARYSSGCMSGPGYSLCDIHWIQYFTASGISFHSAWWHNNFGHPMSHGCVNMRYNSAKWFYDFGDYGTDVYISA